MGPYTLLALAAALMAGSPCAHSFRLRLPVRAVAGFGSGEESKRLLVLGGTGFVGSEVCKIAVQRGFKVTAVSRRGVNPSPGDEVLDQVNYVVGDATDSATVDRLVSEADAVVHAVGLLFDIDSGLAQLNLIVSGSGSTPSEESTYDAVTRVTAFNAVAAIRKKRGVLGAALNSPKVPLAFVSCAEAGWPDVPLGSTVEGVAPDWLKRYLAAKRSVEAEMTSSDETLRPLFYRPSLIWNWKKLDVLPVIPIFNLASAVGIPFVDKTVRVETLAAAIVAGLEDDACAGVQRFPEMESLAARVA